MLVGTDDAVLAIITGQLLCIQRRLHERELQTLNLESGSARVQPPASVGGALRLSGRQGKVAGNFEIFHPGES